MAEERTRRAAVLLRDARLARRPIGPLPVDCRPTDLAEAYRIQEQVLPFFGRNLSFDQGK